MCTGAEMFLIAAATTSAVGSYQQGREQKAGYEFGAQQDEADAIAAREQGEVRADAIRADAVRVKSSATAQYAASGVQLDSGSPMVVMKDIAFRAESDALQEILLGSRQGARLEQDASLKRQAGMRAEMAGKRAALGSLLSAGSKLGSGWKTSGSGGGDVPLISEQVPGQYSTVNKQYG
jgi:hypothetical protein